MKAKEEPTKLGTLPPVTKKKISVPTPLIITQTLASRPIRIGASTLAPNIATTCCRPSAVVCPHGRRSSGAMTTPSAAGFSFQNMSGVPPLWLPALSRFQVWNETPEGLIRGGRAGGKRVEEQDDEGQRDDRE